MTWFQRFLLITIAVTFILVVIGGVVRATDSGLGCPDWPRCHGQIIPPAEKHALIEFTHRTVAAVVGVLFLGVTFFAFKTERKNPLVFWLAFTAGLLLVVQIVLGGITVKRELPAEIVAAHLGTAMAFIGVLMVAAIVSLMQSRGLRGFTLSAGTPFTRMAVLAAATTLLTLVLGSYISGTDASLACGGWPLCNGSVIPGGDSAVGLHFMHRLIAGVLGLLLLGVTYLAFEDRRRQPLLLALALFSLAAYIAQAFIGAANIWTEVATGIVVAHLSLAALLWVATLLIGTLAFYLPGDDVEAEAERREQRREAAQWAR